jgi:hypothetical protein
MTSAFLALSRHGDRPQRCPLAREGKPDIDEHATMSVIDPKRTSAVQLFNLF